VNLCLAGVLDADTLQAVRTTLAGADFADGSRTAGWHAAKVKHNLQATDDGAAQRVQQALMAHELFRAAALPARLRAPLFSRYTTGMGYGRHMDDALMTAGGGASALRADLAVTVFLSEPASYDGGELVIEGPGGTSAYKLEAGQAIVYPATTLHRVADVTRGERLAAVLWVQSLVRDAARREVLFDLDTARRGLWDKAGQTATSEFDLVTKTYANLLRAWSEP
jgi:PKHD-type hydroxylase